LCGAEQAQVYEGDDNFSTPEVPRRPIEAVEPDRSREAVSPMALFNNSLRLSRLPATSIIPALSPQSTCRRYASSSSSSSSSDALTPALRDLQELETESSFSSAPIPSQELAENFDPVARSKSRKEPLPPSR
ncbi:hypothetical protein KEM55_001509, partial [Ascosphaera atra]